jgi:mono/diheme cytochrome c family protein
VSLRQVLWLLAIVIAASLAAAPAPVHGAERAMATVELSEEFLGDAENIATGRALWQEQCAMCHGARAYPGKAPKLRPRRYQPDFVYDRITNGFRGMPGWEDVYDEHERKALVAYILSRSFSP